MYNEIIEKMLQFNRDFVENQTYQYFLTDKYPDKKIAIVSCMDTRLTQLLPAALGLKNGNAKIIKNAGAQIIGPYDSVMKSLLIAVYELGVTDILIVGHDDCGVQHVNSKEMIEKMMERGVPEAEIRRVHNEECDLDKWLSGFADVNQSVCDAVRMVKNCALLPPDIRVFGFIMDPVTGAVREAKN